MKRFLILAVLTLGLLPGWAQDRGVVGSFTLASTSTYITNNVTKAVSATAVDLPGMNPMWVWYTVYGGPEGSQTGAVTCTFASSPDGTTWTTAADTNFIVTATMSGTNRITTLTSFDLTGVRQLKPIQLVNTDTVGTATNISIAYSSRK